MAILLKICEGLTVCGKLLKPRFDCTTISVRGRKNLNPPPRKRFPPWFTKQHRVLHKEEITPENTKFIKEVIDTQYGIAANRVSPLKAVPIEPNIEWKRGLQRTGLIAKKIGVYPMWLKNGRKVLTTLLQIVDNHVIKYIPPEEHKPMIRRTLPYDYQEKRACLLIGAECEDPQLFTKAYCGLFQDSGVMPTRFLMRFLVSPEAALQPGTPLYVNHFKPGDYVDIRGKTMDRGFQGVMKRWGFHGMPASHGVTKSHRRPGNIGSGGTKARVMPGTKMPGHMGNRYRIFRGLRILRINTKYNVMWVLGQQVPGETNNVIQVFDSLLRHRRHTVAPHFPTYFPTNEQEPLPEEILADDVHPFEAKSITFSEEEA
ncbi:39S ribosomal protein L3, mitochondrial [Orussus abietinus]|uniref:39S ribosomal protein L3, mitochondrial n=1 Tax=Orussus abietinus TaxID=222816 RepID=UPI00062615DB|nr:39S ribosomal protein L3, mitochondrial [Orussus abietinus]